MIVLLRIIFGLLLIWCGIKAISQSFISTSSEGLFSEFQYIFFVLTVLLTIITIYLDTKFFILNRRIIQYSISLIGLSFCSIVTFRTLQRMTIDNSKTILKISNLPEATNILDFEFKTNDNFRVIEHDKLGSVIFYGKFSRVHDTLTINETNYSGYFGTLPLIGLIKKDTVYWANFETMLIEK